MFSFQKVKLNEFYENLEKKVRKELQCGEMISYLYPFVREHSCCARKRFRPKKGQKGIDIPSTSSGPKMV